MAKTILSAEQAKFLKQKHDNELILASREMRPYMKKLENSSLAKFRAITDEDAVTLMNQFKAMDTAIEMASGSYGDMGRLPIIKYEFLTYNYGENINNIVASAQTVDEPEGDILYKEIIASDTAGDVTAGAKLASGAVAPQYFKNYGNNGFGITTDTTATASYNISLGGAVVKNSVSVITDIPNASGQMLYGRDDGYGNIIGLGLQGTVNYATGAVALTFASATPAGKAITVNFTSDVETTGDIPRAFLGLNRKHVVCNTIALAEEFGMFQDFVIFKKIGKTSDEEMIQELTNLINFQLFNKLTADLVASVPEASKFTWVRHKSDYVTYAQAVPEVSRKLGQMDGAIKKAAGRGMANVILAGTNACPDLEALEGFESIEVGNYGASIKGKYRNRIVICQPMLDDNKIIGAYRNQQSKFDGACYSAVYMPLYLSDILVGSGGNNAKRERVAYTWAQTGVAVPEMTAQLDILETPVTSA